MSTEMALTEQDIYLSTSIEFRPKRAIEWIEHLTGKTVTNRMLHYWTATTITSPKIPSIGRYRCSIFSIQDIVLISLGIIMLDTGLSTLAMRRIIHDITCSWQKILVDRSGSVLVGTEDMGFFVKNEVVQSFVNRILTDEGVKSQ